MSQFRPVNFNQASVRANELVANTKLGIGTHSQTSELHIKAAAPELQIEGASATMKVVASGTETTFRSDQDVKWTSADAGTVHMTLDGASGYVGVGTVSPSTTLHVTNQGGTFNLGGSLRNQYNSVGVTAASITAGYNTGSGPTNNGDGSYTWTKGGGDTNGAINLGYTAVANEQLKITFTAKSTDTTSPSFAFENPSFNALYSNTLTTGYVTYTFYATLPSNGGGILFFRVSADNITWNALTIERTDVFTGGNVGIGTNQPAALLDVNGNSIINGILFNANKIGFRAFNGSGTALTINQGNLTNQFPNTRYNHQSCYNISTGIFTPPQNGIYYLAAALRLGNAGGSVRRGFGIMHSTNAAIAVHETPSISDGHASVSGLYYLTTAENAYIKNFFASTLLSDTGDFSYFCAHLLCSY